MLETTINRSDYDFSLSVWSEIFDNVQSVKVTDTTATLSFADEKQASDFQEIYISALTTFGNDEDDEPTEVGLRMESIYDQHFLISQMKVA